ncbi:DUF2934 domain-containing protein [Devosia sp. PTR5]|uniref:DUF2934 domain-containing protein n=1 Tax=Devosia oryzisoli TaxID=2774138 RepID=A0A927FWE1_9HYPH|nr:DUF2934 domain-containing protein [Devosia oryzisoli]MBD8066742.1 DUF2934 domain-containing protein [Devosia oryzisoli]
MRKNSALAERIRETAFFLWEQDGHPDGRAMEYWLKAKEMHQRQLAYDRWLADGTPPDSADLHWLAAENDLDEK